MNISTLKKIARNAKPNYAGGVKEIWLKPEMSTTTDENGNILKYYKLNFTAAKTEGFFIANEIILLNENEIEEMEELGLIN